MIVDFNQQNEALGIELIARSAEAVTVARGFAEANRLLLPEAIAAACRQ